MSTNVQPFHTKVHQSGFRPKRTVTLSWAPWMLKYVVATAGNSMSVFQNVHY